MAKTEVHAKDLWHSPLKMQPGQLTNGIHFVFSRSEHFGIIPQSLSLIFEKLEQNQDEAVNLHISFLEIYKETAYDLLGPPLFKGPQKIKDLPKVRFT